MKRYVKSNTDKRQTLREYVTSHMSELQGKNIVVACLEEYEPGEDAVVGVLFDGKITDLVNAPKELTTNDYNYLTQDDLDRCVVKEVHTYGNGAGIEIIIENFINSIEEPELVTNPEYYYQIMNLLDDVALSGRNLTNADRQKLDELFAKDVDAGMSDSIEDYADANDCYTPNGDLCSTWDKMVIALRDLFRSGDRV